MVLALVSISFGCAEDETNDDNDDNLDAQVAFEVAVVDGVAAYDSEAKELQYVSTGTGSVFGYEAATADKKADMNTGVVSVEGGWKKIATISSSYEANKNGYIFFHKENSSITNVAITAKAIPENEEILDGSADIVTVIIDGGASEYYITSFISLGTADKKVILACTQFAGKLNEQTLLPEGFAPNNTDCYVGSEVKTDDADKDLDTVKINLMTLLTKDDTKTPGDMKDANGDLLFEMESPTPGISAENAKKLASLDFLELGEQIISVKGVSSLTK